MVYKPFGRTTEKTIGRLSTGIHAPNSCCRAGAAWKASKKGRLTLYEDVEGRVFTDVIDQPYNELLETVFMDGVLYADDTLEAIRIRADAKQLSIIDA